MRKRGPGVVLVYDKASDTFVPPPEPPTLADVLANIARYKAGTDRLDYDVRATEPGDRTLERSRWNLAWRRLTVFLAKLMLWTGVLDRCLRMH